MYKILLAFRYLLKRRITYLAVAAVGLCVFMVVVVMTVMSGLANDFKVKNHDWVGDCVIGSESLVGFSYYEDFLQVLDKAEFVEAASPVIQSYALLAYDPANSNVRVEIMGIDPERYCRVTGFGRTIYYNKRNCAAVFTSPHSPNKPGCVPGIDLVIARDNLGKYYHRRTIPDASFAISSFPLTAGGALAKADIGVVNTMDFCYSDDSHSGLAKVDESFVYLPFEQAQKLCGMDGTDKRASKIFVRFRAGVDLETGVEKITGLWQKFVKDNAGRTRANLFENVTVQSWKSYRREVIAPVETEQLMMMLTFTIVAIVTVFIIFVIFYMLVSHKSKDIGVLKSIGVRDNQVARLFLLLGGLVGLCGSIIGTAGGILFLAKINQIEAWLYRRYDFQLWDRAMYAIDEIPNQIEPETLIVIGLAAILVCLAGAVFPSLQAARRQPTQTLQVNQL
ncbi:MAG: FtsX-like permease family protein [Planctomycetota bacterium]